MDGMQCLLSGCKFPLQFLALLKGVLHTAEGNGISFVSGDSAQNLRVVNVRGMIAPAIPAPHGKGLLLDLPLPRHVCHFVFLLSQLCRGENVFVF